VKTPGAEKNPWQDQCLLPRKEANLMFGTIRVENKRHKKGKKKTR
jgi:hypothetical protein